MRETKEIRRLPTQILNPPEGQRKHGAAQQRDRRLLGSVADFLGIVDLVAIMMVIATVCTAIATWRTASIATAIYMASERPYMGVSSVTFATDRPGDPRIVIEYKNFGSVAAEGVVMFRRLSIDGKVVHDQTRRKDAGILSPGPPHRLFMHVSQAVYGAVVAGRSKDTGRNWREIPGAASWLSLFFERYAYEIDEGLFDVDGGSPRCEELVGLEATADPVPWDQE